MDKKFKEQVASLMQDRSQRDALAELIVEFIDPQHIAVDFVGMLLNSRALKEGDALVKKVRKGITVRTLVPGAIHLASEVTISERANYILDGSDVKVTANEWELEAGEIGSVADIRAEMLAQLRDTYMNKVFTALTTVWNATNTPNNYTAVGGSITAAALESAIDRINQTAGGVKAVVGVKSAMTPITKFGAFWNDDGTQWQGVDSQLEKVMADGVLGKYYGAPLVHLQQQWDNPEDYNALLPTDKILVIGENVGEFITYGEPREKQWTDMQPTPPQWFLEIYQRHGMIIDKAQGIYVLGVS